MSFLSGLKVFGTDIEKVFGWFGSAKGQAVVKAGEAAVETIAPQAAPIVDLFDSWAQRAYNIESIAAAAGQQTGTGAQKAVLVNQAIAPTVLQYAQAAGLSARTADQISRANNAVIDFINAMTEPASGATTSTPSPSISTTSTPAMTMAEPVAATVLEK